MQKIIGITGSIATGKSTISKIIKKKYPLIDADLIAKELCEFNNKGYIAIKQEFGNEYFTNENLNRKKLADLIFSNPQAKLKLDAIMHPLVYKEIEEQLKKLKGLIFLDIPLLFETNYEKNCDVVICVYTKKNIQIKRLQKRNNLNYEEALKIVESQVDIEKKKELANFTINNNYDRKNTKKQTLKIIKYLKNIN